MRLCRFCDAAWQNPSDEVAAVFTRVLRQDRWGLKTVIVACLTTGGDGAMSRNPYLRSKTNYSYFKDALCPDASVPTEKQA